MSPGRIGPAQSSLWWATLARCGPGAVALQYVTLARVGARQADPATFATTAREDVTRLATALTGVIDLHTPDGRHHCQACSAGTLLIDWSCPTRRTIDDGLRHGWPTPATVTEPDPAPDSHEAFALAVLAVHDILPAAGGQPATCRTCHTPPDQCPVWALAEGFLGLTWTNPVDQVTAGAQ